MPEAGIWSLEQVIQDNPLGDEPTKWTYLVEGAHSTINVLQVSSFNTPHIHHEHDETVYCLKGEAKIRLGDKTYPFKVGDMVFIPAGAVHTYISDSYLAVLSVYSPYFDPKNPDREFVKP